jgi:hypothetical protein
MMLKKILNIYLRTSESTINRVHPRTYLSQNKNPSQMIFFKGNYRRRPLQGGQFQVNRKSSQPCLERWRHFIDAYPEDPKDQSALTLMLQEQNISGSVCHLPLCLKVRIFGQAILMTRLVKSQEP